MTELTDEQRAALNLPAEDPPDTGGFGDFLSSTGGMLFSAGIGVLFGGRDASGAQTQGSQGYAGGIPDYQFNRQQIPYQDLNDTSRSAVPGTDIYPPRRPGEFGRSYFVGTPDPANPGQTLPMYTPKSAENSIMGYEQLKAMNDAAKARQDELDTLGQSLLEQYNASRQATKQKQQQQNGTTQQGGRTPITQVSTSDQYYTGDEKQALYDAVLRGELTLEDIAYATGAPLSRVQEEYNRLASEAYPDTGDINAYISWASGQWINPESLVTGKQTQYLSPSQINPQETVINKVEAGNILRAAMEQGISPEEVAAAVNQVMPISEQEVVDWIKTNYPNVAKDYLASYGYAAGGLASLGGKGYYLGGRTDGMADRIPARINNQQPAALSDGEFVVPADVVSHLGNGNSNAGADVLYSMMDRIRKDRTGRKSQGRQINPSKYIPA